MGDDREGGGGGSNGVGGDCGRLSERDGRGERRQRGLWRASHHTLAPTRRRRSSSSSRRRRHHGGRCEHSTPPELWRRTSRWVRWCMRPTHCRGAKANRSCGRVPGLAKLHRRPSRHRLHSSNGCPRMAHGPRPPHSPLASSAAIQGICLERAGARRPAAHPESSHARLQHGHEACAHIGWTKARRCRRRRWRRRRRRRRRRRAFVPRASSVIRPSGAASLSQCAHRRRMRRLHHSSCETRLQLSHPRRRRLARHQCAGRHGRLHRRAGTRPRVLFGQGGRGAHYGTKADAARSARAEGCLRRCRSPFLRALGQRAQVGRTAHRERRAWLRPIFISQKAQCGWRRGGRAAEHASTDRVQTCAG